MKIFDSYQQAVKFAFLLGTGPETPQISHEQQVRMALREAGTNVPAVLLDAPTLRMIGQFGAAVLGAVALGMMSTERAVLTAHYSTDWEERRTVTAWLQNHYHVQLSHVAGNPQLVDRIVSRHYIAERDRGQGWTVEDIASEFKIGYNKLHKAIALLEKLDGEIHENALATLAQRLDLPMLEAEHA
jgi:hypothetical protein